MPYIKGTYYTDSQIQAIRRELREEEFQKFLISGVIGAATGSSVIGGLVGGSLVGGLVGDLLEGTDDSIF